MHALAVASTGPRPRGRGMEVWTGLDERASVRFNGAAPARARNADGSRLPSVGLLEPSFNGAAPARARNDRMAGEPVPAATGASTGPRPRGRGMVARAVMPTTARRMLQRGRARAGAEWTDLDLQPQSASRFNGAAPARARNARTGSTELMVPSGLQRGRARAGAECRDCTGSVQPPPTLQRGRARAGAECHANTIAHAPANAASTGPRPRGRGMDRHGLAIHPCFRDASTGPRPRGRGMSLQRQAIVACAWRASTGPRPRGRGMPASPGARPARPAELQRGRARAGAECGICVDASRTSACFNGAAPARARNAD